MKLNSKQSFCRRGMALTAFFLTTCLSLALPEDSPPVESPANAAETACFELGEVLTAISRNLKEQEDAWPTREKDQAREWPAPKNVQELQSALGKLQLEKGKILRRIESEAAKDIKPLLQALTQADDPAIVEALAPVAARTGREDPETVKALLGAARFWDPCPSAVMNALADLDSEEASIFLLEMGLKESSLSILSAAGKSGDPTVLGRLIDAADGSDEAIAALCLRAITLLELPSHSERGIATSSRSAGEREKMVTSRIVKTRSPALKAALITYLGLSRNASHIDFLRGVYGSSQSESARLAVIGALGNLGERAGDFLLAELSNEKSSLAIRIGCIHSLGSLRYRPAIRPLMDLLSDPKLRGDAARGLQRVSGQNFGEKTGLWIRWWRTQPEALLAERNADEKGEP